MNKENFLFPIVAVIVLGAVAITGIVFGGSEKVTERVIERIEQGLGGLVHNVHEIFSAGVKMGATETEFTVDSSGNIVIAGTATIAGETNLDTLVYGGTATEITAASSTLTAAQMCNNSIIKFHLVDDAITADTVYLASSSDMIADCTPVIGDTKEFLFNNNATATLALTIAVPDSTRAIEEGCIKLLEATAGAVILDANEYAIIKFTNIDGTTTTVTVIDLIDADSY